MRGRRPKGTVIKLLTGNPGKRKLNRNEPHFSSETINPPPFLNAAALEEWNRLIPDLQRNGLVTSADVACFAAYCTAYSRWQKAEMILQGMMETSEGTLLGGMAFKTHRGNLSTNPLIRIANASMEIMLRTAAEFCLTPSSRSRVGRGSASDLYSRDGYDPSEGDW